MTDIEKITEQLVKFRKDRKWGKDHTPKNLAISISIEAAELLECYQWGGMSSNASAPDEVADIFIYLLNFCEVTGIDLLEATREKIKKNAIKYPV